jgi:hypothetical protein
MQARLDLCSSVRPPGHVRLGQCGASFSARCRASGSPASAAAASSACPAPSHPPRHRAPKPAGVPQEHTGASQK